MQLLRRILQNVRPTLLALTLVLIAMLFLSGHPARACWNIIESTCFDYPSVPANWGSAGLQHPSNSGRFWWRYPNPPYEPATPPPPSVTWDLENQVYDIHMCQNNIQAIWCNGWPRNHDPRMDNYPNYDSAYVTYGPIDLSQGAVAAGCSFYLYNRSEVAHDSLYYGCVRGAGANAKKLHLLPRDSIYIAGVSSVIMHDQTFQASLIDFSHLRNLVTGDTVSFLGSSNVYCFWRFRSDNNNIGNTGAFIDNVSVSWDDGGRDLEALTCTMKKMDSTLWTFPLVPLDTAWAAFTWMSCAGGLGDYPDFEIIGRVDTMVVLDTIIHGAASGLTVTMATRPWILMPDTHVVRFFVDVLDSVEETNEANDSVTFTYVVPPLHPAPTFLWTAPAEGGGPLYGDQTATLKWEAYRDPDVPATLTFGSNADGSTCTGITLPGGESREVLNGKDSLVWTLTSYNYGRMLYPYVRIRDAFNDTCIHSPYPVIRREAQSVEDHGLGSIPEHFYLAQNYPNPFNPATDLRFGVARAGHVNLTVYNLLGREVAVLVNGDRAPGSYTVEFDGGSLPSGLYLYKLTTPEGTQSRKMMLMK